jgi:mRNA-degrading endonuclease RelE of RelBE toxin-antitoxin system
MARLRYQIVLAPEARRDFEELPATIRAEVWDGINRHLPFEPTRVNRSRIKRLRGLVRPQYRLRLRDVRIFYDVRDDTVEVLAIITKARAEEWLRESGR